MTDLLPIFVGLGGLAASGIAILTFWMKFSDRITVANSAAERAEALAKEAKSDAHETQQNLAIQTAAFGLYREQIAKEYIHREVMREVEDRLTAAINRLGDRFDKVISAKMAGN